MTDNAIIFTKESIKAHDAKLLDKVAEKIEKGCTCIAYSCGSPFTKDCTHCRNYMIEYTSIMQIIKEMKAEVEE